MENALMMLALMKGASWKEDFTLVRNTEMWPNDSLIVDSVTLVLGYGFQQSDLPGMTRWVSPVYPREALEAGLEGKVTVQIWVNKEGDIIPGRERILASTDTIFNESALQAARACKFTPLQSLESIVVCIPYSFRIREKATDIMVIVTDGSGTVEITIEPPDSLRGSIGLLFMSGPTYPREALAQGLGGEVSIGVDVDLGSGRVKRGSERVISSTDPVFIWPALESAETCVFASPKILSGAVRVNMLFSFHPGGDSHGK